MAHEHQVDVVALEHGDPVGAELRLVATSDAEKTGWWKVTTFHFDGLFCSSRSSQAPWKRIHSSSPLAIGQSALVHDGSAGGVRKVASRVALSVMKRTPW